MAVEVGRPGSIGIIIHSVSLVMNNCGVLLKLLLVTLVAMAVTVTPWLVGASVSGISIGNAETVKNIPLPFALWGGGTTLIGFCIFVIFYASVVAYTCERFRGRDLTIKKAIDKGIKTLLPLLITTFIIFIFLMLLSGFSFLILSTIHFKLISDVTYTPLVVVVITIVLGIYLYLRWGVVGQVVVAEGIVGFKALKRSAFLMKNNMWSLFFIQAFFVICSVSIRLSVNMLENSAVIVVVDGIAQILLFFLSVTSHTILYLRSKQRYNESQG